MKLRSLPALCALLLLGSISACHNSVDFNGTVATNSTKADLGPAPSVSSSHVYELHSEIPIAAANTPVATSKKYKLILGSAANDNH